jgi:hypothetical protein
MLSYLGSKILLFLALSLALIAAYAFYAKL